MLLNANSIHSFIYPLVEGRLLNKTGRLMLAERFMNEVDEYLKKGDPVQASEKAYKVAKEVVKALSEKFNLPEYQQAVKEGRWYTYLKASSSLVIRLRPYFFVFQNQE
ncbi:MAG: PaREP1 family protein [Ignisphaera sp.]